MELLILYYAILILTSGSAAGLLILLERIKRVIAKAPRLEVDSNYRKIIPDTSLSIIAPAYNEASNIRACLLSIAECASPCLDWNLLVIDNTKVFDP